MGWHEDASGYQNTSARLCLWMAAGLCALMSTLQLWGKDRLEVCTVYGRGRERIG